MNAFRVRVGDQLLLAAQVVLDTGTRSRIPPIEGLDNVNFIYAENWLESTELPEHLVIIGGGYIGLEMSQREPISQPNVRERKINLIRGDIQSLRLRLNELGCGLIKLEEKPHLFATPARSAKAKPADPCRLNPAAPLRLSTRP